MDALDLAYGFDVSLFNHIENKNLLEHIQRVGVEFYNKAAFEARQQRKNSRLDYAEVSTQSEAQLEASLVQRLTGLGYERVKITDADQSRANLKKTAGDS